MRTHERELFHLIRSIRPDVVVLSETRADVRPSLEHVWQGAKIEQALPLGSPARAGTAVIVIPGHDMRTLGSCKRTGERGKGLTKLARIQINEDTKMTGM